MSLATQTPSIVASRPQTANDVGTITSAATSRGVSKKETGPGGLRCTEFTLSGTAIATTDATTSGAYGSLQLLDFPDGHLCIVGAVTNFTSIVAAAGIGATAAVKHSLGTAAETTNDTLDSTQADILPSTSVTLAASTGNGGGVNTAIAYSDGTATAKDLFLNIGVADAGSTANSTVTISGTIKVWWILLGDK